MKKNFTQKQGPPVFVISCGEGINGEQLLKSALVQFPDYRCQLKKIAHVKRREQVEKAVLDALEVGGIILHTLVSDDIRAHLESFASKHNIAVIDAMGPLLDILSEKFNTKPICEPGRFRRFNQVDMNRINAIEFAVSHDDGVNPHDLEQAEIILVGVSRSGKTPLSMYLAFQGWKVANVPVVVDLPLIEELLYVDKRRVIALFIDAEQLMSHRRIRRGRVGMDNTGIDYSSASGVFKEVEAVRKLYRQNRFTMINVSNKPIESSAEEVVSIIKRRFPGGAHK
ncbi:MAG: kinase/pyrophosphorylase [Desulfobacteraceae bacterium]|nr:kinase/pyrophosphorylase [Desulfobacteraceae bacterium]MCB9494330.1 kinase/pyrophosphorylase [Desulfobacteraceae bacterium]